MFPRTQLAKCLLNSLATELNAIEPLDPFAGLNDDTAAQDRNHSASGYISDSDEDDNEDDDHAYDS